MLLHVIETTIPVYLAFRLIAERQNEDYWRNFGTKENSLIAPSLS